MIRLVPMTEEDYHQFLQHSIKNYAEEKTKAGNYKAEDALQQAEKEFQELLPEGKETPNQYFYNIENESGQKVGIMWVATHEFRGQREAFIFDVEIYEEYRRQGYAQQAFTLLEDKVRELGLNKISLHVFGHNHAARVLYEKLGYQITNISMSKKI